MRRSKGLRKSRENEQPPVQNLTERPKTGPPNLRNLTIRHTPHRLTKNGVLSQFVPNVRVVRFAGQQVEEKVPCLDPRGETVRRPAVQNILCCKTRKIGHYRGKSHPEIRVVLLKLCLDLKQASPVRVLRKKSEILLDFQHR